MRGSTLGKLQSIMLGLFRTWRFFIQMSEASRAQLVGHALRGVGPASGTSYLAHPLYGSFANINLPGSALGSCSFKNVIHAHIVSPCFTVSLHYEGQNYNVVNFKVDTGNFLNCFFNYIFFIVFCGY